MNTTTVQRFADPAAVAEAAAARIATAAREAIADRGVFVLVLAGGNTPRAAYRVLAGHHRDAVDWGRVVFYFGDERCVPPEDPLSNFRMARESLLDPLGIAEARVARMPGEADPPEGAAAYEERLLERWRPGGPYFDLVLLGMGEEGHTASLFPGSPALKPGNRLVLSVEVPAVPANRLTLTPRAFTSTREMIFVVTGAAKRQALAVATGHGENVPAALVAGLAPSKFLVDDDAAGLLPAPTA